MQYTRVRVADRYVMAMPVSKEPTVEFTVRLDKPEPVISKPEQDALHEQPALMDAGQNIPATANLDGTRAPRENPVKKGHGIGAGYLDRPFRHIIQNCRPAKRPISRCDILAIIMGKESARRQPQNSVRVGVANVKR